MSGEYVQIKVSRETRSVECDEDLEISTRCDTMRQMMLVH